MKKILVEKNVDLMTRKELCDELYQKYINDGLDPNLKPITLTKQEFRKRYLNGSKYYSKKQLTTMLGRKEQNGKENRNGKRSKKNLKN